jgi:tetratricopeptide (TPR) repeat protein
MIYLGLENYDKAKQNGLEAIKIREEQNIPGIIATENSRLGKIYLFSGERELARKHLSKAYHIIKELNVTAGLTSIAMNYSLYFKSIEQYQSALKYLNEALKISKINKLRSIRQDIYYKLYEVYNKLNDPANSLKYFKLNVELGDSLNKEKANNKILLAQIEKDLIAQTEQNNLLIEKNKLQQLELENSRLVRYLLIASVFLAIMLVITFYLRLRDKTRAAKEISIQSEQLAKLNTDKDKFFSIMSHDLKNPIQSTFRSYRRVISKF